MHNNEPASLFVTPSLNMWGNPPWLSIANTHPESPYPRWRRFPWKTWNLRCLWLQIHLFGDNGGLNTMCACVLFFIITTHVVYNSPSFFFLRRSWKHVRLLEKNAPHTDSNLKCMRKSIMTIFAIDIQIDFFSIDNYHCYTCI